MEREGRFISVGKTGAIFSLSRISAADWKMMHWLRCQWRHLGTNIESLALLPAQRAQIRHLDCYLSEDLLEL